MDRYSARLLQELLVGKPAEVTVSVDRVGTDRAAETLTYVLSAALLSGHSQSASSGDSAESLTIAFRKLTLSYQNMNDPRQDFRMTHDFAAGTA